MSAFLVFIAGLAGTLALVRIAQTAHRIGRANRLRTQELRNAAAESARPSSGPESIETLQQVDAAARDAVREDYTLSGVLLAGFGVAAMFAGRGVAFGEWAVGLYTAGSIAIVAGIGLAIVGAVFRLLAEPILEPPNPVRTD